MIDAPKKTAFIRATSKKLKYDVEVQEIEREIDVIKILIDTPKKKAFEERAWFNGFEMVDNPECYDNK